MTIPFASTSKELAIVCTAEVRNGKVFAHGFNIPVELRPSDILQREYLEELEDGTLLHCQIDNNHVIVDYEEA
jgi:hypothetical protein